jgi:cyanophycin synthetase
MGRPDDDLSAYVVEPRAPMGVLDHTIYRGAHYYSHTPMIRIMVDLGRLEQWPTSRLEGFADRLLVALPGLARHQCSRGHAGGFVERLREGTWLGHVAEHVALELQCEAGHRVTRGKTRAVKGRPGVYNVLFAYREEEVGLAAGRIALELVDDLLPERLSGLEGADKVALLEGAFNLPARRAQLARIAAARALGPTTQALVDEAERRRIPVTRLGRGSLIRLGQGRYQQLIRASITGKTALLAAEAAGDKDYTKQLLAAHGIPVPTGVVVRGEAEALRAAAQLGYPLVTKPRDGNHGRGITTGIHEQRQLCAGFAAALAEAKRGEVIVERFFAGRDHRILVVDGKVVAVAQRVPAAVTGNGVSTIEELVAAVNRDPRRGVGHEKVMTRIALDKTTDDLLAQAGLTRDSVPARGETVVLAATANLSTGGTAIDRTNEVHADNAAIAARAAMVLGLDVAGVDFIAPAIASPVRETGGGVIEVNAAPGFRMHLAPSEGASRDVARPVIEMLFPRRRRSRVPIFAITGTNGKSTTTRMLRHIFRFTGKIVGMTSTAGAWVNDTLIVPGDATGPRSARMVLSDPCVEVAILETARGGILREGLGFGEADVGAVLNVTADHLGLKGIDTIEELAEVKSLIIESVRRRGASVLNADDPLTRRMARRAGGKIIWFSLDGGEQEMQPWLRDHIGEGGAAVVREPGPDGGTIVLHREGLREAVLPAASIPATLHGLAVFNIANALAAAAMAAAHGISLPTIRSALGTFQSDFENNPGRLNVHDAHGFRAIMDYAHNVAGLEALGEVIEGLRHRYQRTIGVISVPGDRRDEDILAMARISARLFDELVFREDPVTRGRPRGELLGLLRRGAEESGLLRGTVRAVQSEPDANAIGLALAGPGDLLVLTPSDVAGCWKQVTEFRPAEAQPRSVPAAHAEQSA